MCVWLINFFMWIRNYNDHDKSINSNSMSTHTTLYVSGRPMRERGICVVNLLQLILGTFLWILACSSFMRMLPSSWVTHTFWYSLFVIGIMAALHLGLVLIYGTSPHTGTFISLLGCLGEGRILPIFFVSHLVFQENVRLHMRSDMFVRPSLTLLTSRFLVATWIYILLV